jgi:ferredoxin
MAKLIFEPSGQIEELKVGSPIGDVCEKHGIPRACSQGICGTCIVQILEGGDKLSPPTQAEIDFLGEDGVGEERMACQCRIEKEGTIKIRF